jgi:hypothetical protein
VFKRHSFAVLGLLAATTTTTSPDCSLESAKLLSPTEPVCSELSPDIQASNGWRSVQASQTAEGELFFRYQARPAVAGLNGLLAIAPQPVDTFSDAAILVRFAADGSVDARNGSMYDSDVAFPYEPGVWYDISVSADLSRQVYNVDIGRCGEQLTRLISNAAFRSDAPDSSQLTHWAAWSSQSATLDVATPSWGTAGSCQPFTCQSLGWECGTASDSCGGSLNCGACGNGDVCVSGACSSPGVTGVPYGHVTPADVGVTIGVGVVGPVPTKEYTGSCKPAANTTIENVVINNCGRIVIDNPNITMRNVILNATSDSGAIYLDRTSGDSSNFTVEYSQINQLNGNGMVFLSFTKVGDPIGGNKTNCTIRNNEITGGYDFHYLEGGLDGFLSENNYYHDLNVDPNSGKHADGFQIGEANLTTGQMTIRGNYFDPNNAISKTALLFSAGSDSYNNTDILWENNFIPIWGAYTLWCSNSASCIMRYNVYRQDFKTKLGNRTSGTGRESDGYPNCAGTFSPANESSSVYRCNRYEDGDFIENQWVCIQGGAKKTHDISGCPSYP